MSLMQSKDDYNNSSSNFSNDYHSNDNDDRDDEHDSADNDSEESADNKICADKSIPRDWIPLINPALGDTYFSNETTGEVTWDKPQSNAMERRDNQGPNRSSPQVQEEEHKLSSQQLNSHEDETEDNAEPASVDDEDLPEGWFSIVDPDSGDVLGQQKMLNNDLSGDGYYANKNSGETSWDKPQSLLRLEKSPRTKEEKRLSLNGNGQDDDDDLPVGWFAVTDPQSGETYYANET
ncbi:hypothetical protein ACHAWX_000165, partial [Stephanocyclus meneghinianus]